jgi:flagellar L-ring protein precursor FlgH
MNKATSTHTNEPTQACATTPAHAGRPRLAHRSIHPVAICAACALLATSQAAIAQSLFKGEPPARAPSTQESARPGDKSSTTDDDAAKPGQGEGEQATSENKSQPTSQPASQPANAPANQQAPAPSGSPAPTATKLRTPGSQDRAQLAPFSLLSLEPPEPREISVHDTVFIIINETSKQSSTSKLDTKTSVSNQGRINSIPDLAALLELQLRNGDSNPLVSAGMSGNENWKGDGKFERSDRFSDRIAATVIDVKPNGTLVLEARRTIGKDDEVQTVLVSGIARREDVTNANTVLSSQLADLVIVSETSGELREATQKGWITRVFEAVFNF